MKLNMKSKIKLSIMSIQNKEENLGEEFIVKQFLVSGECEEKKYF